MHITIHLAYQIDIKYPIPYLANTIWHQWENINIDIVA